MDRLGQLTLDKLSLDRVKNMVGEVRDTIAPRNETEKRVYEALSNKNWGASSTLLNDIARDTYDFEKYGMILPLIWTALQCPSREWRKVFKALSLLEHLVKNGAERVIEDARDNLHRVRMLSDFNYYEGPVDKGSGVREKSKQLIDLLKDNEMIREEREKARKLRDKYVGLGSGGGFGGGGYSGGGSSYSSGGGGYGGDRYGNGPSRYGDSSYSSGGGGYNDRGGGYSDRGGGYSDRGGSGYNDSVDREGFRGGYGYSDTRAEDKSKSKDTEKDQEPSSSSLSSSSKPKRDRKKSSAPKLAIKIKDKDKDKGKSSSAETPAVSAPVPDLLGGDLLTTAPAPAPTPAPVATSGQLGDLFAAPVAAAPASGGSGNVGLDSFDPRASSSAGTAATTTGGFGHDFVGFAPAPVPVATPAPAFPGTGGTAAFGSTADPFAAAPAPVLGSSGGSYPGVLNRTNSATNGADEFSDFQSSGPATTGASGDNGSGSASGGGTTNGGTGSAPGGITNPKWRDVSSLVDLGGLSSNTDKKVAQQKQEEQTFQSNNNSFAGLDGFQSKPQGMGMTRPPAGPTGLSGGVHAVGMMGGGTGFQQQQAMRGGLMGAHHGMVFPASGFVGQQTQPQQAFGAQGTTMGMGMGGMSGQQTGTGMGMGMGMQQGGGAMGNKRGMQAGAAAGAGGAAMPGGFTGTGASGSFY